MSHIEAVVCILGIACAALVCCCACFCRNLKSSSPSDPPPSPPPPGAITGHVYFYDMTQATAPDDSAPPPYHLATLYPPVDSRQLNPPIYGQTTCVWWSTDVPSSEHAHQSGVDVNRFMSAYMICWDILLTWVILAAAGSTYWQPIATLCYSCTHVIDESELNPL